MFCLAPANAYVSRPTTINSPLLFHLSSFFFFIFFFLRDISFFFVGRIACKATCRRQQLPKCRRGSRLRNKSSSSSSLRHRFLDSDTQLCSSGANGSLHLPRKNKKGMWLLQLGVCVRLKCLCLQEDLSKVSLLQPYVCVDRWVRAHCSFWTLERPSIATSFPDHWKMSTRERKETHTTLVAWVQLGFVASHSLVSGLDPDCEPIKNQKSARAD